MAMGAVWLWSLAGFLLMEVASGALAAVTIVLRLVAMPLGLLGMTLAALAGLALLAFAGWLWLDQQLMSLASVWLPERRKRP
jgi:hypothetical protein